MNKPIIGHNISISNNRLVSSADYAEELGAGVYQIFLASPQDYKFAYHQKSTLNELKNKLIEKNIKIVVHANYMLNFCNPTDDYKHTQAVKLLVSDLKDSVEFNSIGVIGIGSTPCQPVGGAKDKANFVFGDFHYVPIGSVFGGIFYDVVTAGQN